MSEYPVTEIADDESEEITYFEPEVIEEPEQEVPETADLAATTEFAFSTDNEFEASAGVTENVSQEISFVTPETSLGGYQTETVTAPVAEIQKPSPTRSRYSERNMDLPIDVPEDERRFHNNARRFARLLVSEIKLYNEQKVNEGRGSRDLYDGFVKRSIGRVRCMTSASNHRWRRNSITLTTSW